MTDTALVQPEQRRPGGALRFLWYRQVDHYPDTGPRLWYLAIAVLATIMLYYELYDAGTVSTDIIAQFHMSFLYYVYISVVGNALGAFGSLFAGLADRWGRANLVVYGLAITGLLILFGIPNAHSEWAFAIVLVAVSLVEGVILVATPALIRDFSPQLGRAAAMGFWTLGPVMGSLVSDLVATNTLPHLPPWQDQFIICGIAGLGVFAIALFGLRELSPRIRDQLMVSIRDRALIEARAQGIDIEEGLRHPWRQMLHLDVIGSAFGISVFLIIYYTAVGFFTVYFTTIFGFTVPMADGIGNWFWAFDAGALVVFGLLSDALRVRKPFMIFGATGAIVMTIIFLTRATHPTTGYYTFVWMISVLSVFLAITYAPWMASFTETVERRNPALTATGLAVWGWIIRVVIAVSLLVLPALVSSATPLVTYGAKVKAIATKYGPQLATLTAYGPRVEAIARSYPTQVKALQSIDPTTLATLQANPSSSAAIGKAVSEISAGLHVSSLVALGDLVAVSKVPKSDLAYLAAHGAAVAKADAAIPPADLAYVTAHGTDVAAAAKQTPSQWQHWWWVCVGGEVVFLPLVLLMTGRWRPKRAKQDAQEHERRVREEMAKLGIPTAAS
ncbi:MAG: MFS transporter [Actinomycetota bacterium]|nr:MFS transporter [Actinomycetota bacterium]